MDVFHEAAEALSESLKCVAGETVRFQNDTTTVTLTAALGKTLLNVETTDGAGIIQAMSTDFLIDAADIGEADASNRSSLAKLTALSLEDVSVDFKIPWNAADANFLLLRNARVNRSSVAVAVLDGPDTQTGSFGFWADWVVTKFVREEPLTGTMVASVTLKPTPSAVPPQWVAVQ